MIPELHNHLEIDFDTVLDANALPQKVVRRWPNERENKKKHSCRYYLLVRFIADHPFTRNATVTACTHGLEIRPPLDQ